MKKLYLLLIFGIFLFSFIHSINAIGSNFGSATRNEYYNVIGNDWDTVSSRSDGQGFTIGITGPNTTVSLIGISVKLFACGAGGTPYLNMTLQEGNGSSLTTPSGPILAWSNQSIVGLTASSVGEWVNFTFVQNPTLTTSNQYVWVIQQAPSGNTCPLWNTSAGYDGTTDSAWSDGLSPNPQTGKDFLFEVWGSPPIVSPSITLDAPLNNSVFSTTSLSFNATETGNTYNLTNVTYNIFYINNTLFNRTTIPITGTSNTTNLTINGFGIGNYLFGATVCQGDEVGTNCTVSNNNSFSIGASLSSLTFNNNSFETKQETFSAMFNIIPSSQISLIQLVYNGTNYTITNITTTSENLTVTKTIDIPLNVNASANQTNNFYFNFVYNGGSTQQSGTYQQNSSFIKLIQCGSPYTIQALNFTLYDEINQSVINSAVNLTTFEISFKYWLGNGTVNKSYSFQNLSSSINNYQFCIYPYNMSNNFTTDSDMAFSAIGYRDNNYYLRSSILTNVSSDIRLYLLSDDFASKFFLTFLNGVTSIKNAMITVQKYFTGLGQFQTVGIIQSDSDGKTTMWQEVDSNYRYSIVQDGVLLGSVDRISSCAATPCSLTLTIPGSVPSVFSPYYDYYAQNVLSNLSFNKTSSIVTYDFIDTTGLAHSFRLVVNQNMINGTLRTICDTTSYSTAGEITCNVTGYNGDFVATGYISRSPEKVDKVLGFIVEESVVQNLGLTGIFLICGLIITLVFVGAAMSGGSPTVILYVLGISLLGLKLIGILPFSWIFVVATEVIILYFITKVKI